MGGRKIQQHQSDSNRFMQAITSRYTRAGVLGLFLLGILFTISLLYQPSTLPFRTIQVYGQLKWMDKDELNALVLKDIDGGFFSLNVDDLKQSLEKQPWIKTVAIRRAWPDVLQLTVTEQQPVAVWNNEFVINREGELFAPGAQQLPEYLVQVSGPSGMHQTLMAYYFALAAQAEDVGLRIAAISVNERRALQVILSNGIRLLLGRVRNTAESEEEMQRFIYAYKANLSPKLDHIQLVDLRYTNGLAVRWKQQSEKNQNQTQSVVDRISTQG